MKHRSNAVVYSINNKQVSIEEFYSSLGAATQSKGWGNHLWPQVKETPTTGWTIDDQVFAKVSIEFCDLIADTSNGSGGAKVYFEEDSKLYYITANDLDFAILDPIYM